MYGDPKPQRDVWKGPSGKEGLGNSICREGDGIDVGQVEQLAREAARLNREPGDPTARS